MFRLAQQNHTLVEMLVFPNHASKRATMLWVCKHVQNQHIMHNEVYCIKHTFFLAERLHGKA